MKVLAESESVCEMEEVDGSSSRRRRAVSSGEHTTTVDASCTRLSVVLTSSSTTGSLPTMTARNPSLSSVTFDSAISSTNIAIAHIDDPALGKWKINHPARSDLSYSVSCVRDLRIKQEFMRLTDNDKGISSSHTSIHPVAGKPQEGAQ